MIGLLLPILARVGVPERFRRAVALIGTVIAVAGLCALLWTCWLRSHDAEVIDTHEAGISEQVTTATTAANDVATANDAERRANDARVDESLRKAIADAEKANPVEVRHDAGPATRATLERLRQRAPAPRPSADR
jgi:hypothetical protein